MQINGDQKGVEVSVHVAFRWTVLFDTADFGLFSQNALEHGHRRGINHPPAVVLDRQHSELLEQTLVVSLLP